MAAGPRGSGRRTVLAGLAAAPLARPARAAPATLAVSARTRLGPFRREGFDMVGVFDIDWLAEPRLARVLDAMAASPGAFGAVRVFGVLNAGEREQVNPTTSGTVWPAPEAPMDFTAPLRGLEALVSRGLTPFLPLAFFPAAVSPSPVEPPADLARFGALVRGFLDAAAARFGAAEVGRWWLEAWNEPNIPAFFRGGFERYLDLYRATAEAVRASGHRPRLGGPVIAWLPGGEGERLMRRFLEFLRDAPELPCDFLSFHRKGSWGPEEPAPRLARLVEAAEQTAAMARALVPGRCRGLAIIDDEADEIVGFDTPYAFRMDERMPAWLAASAIAHAALTLRHAEEGLRFVAAADNANQHLVRAPFDGRRALFTRTDTAPDDLVKLPAFQFYELLRLLEGEVAAMGTGPVHHLVVAGEAGIAALLVRDPDAPPRAARLRYELRDIPWPRVNLAVLRIDARHANAFAAAGRRMPGRIGPAEARRLRRTAELGLDAPLRSGLAVADGRLGLDLAPGPQATLLAWVTPFDATVPERPRGLLAEPRHGNLLLRWDPSRVPGFWSYELLRRAGTGPWRRIAPVPLRGAEWVDTAPPAGPLEYRLRTVSASGVRGPEAGIAARR